MTEANARIESKNEDGSVQHIHPVEDFPDESTFLTQTEYPALRIPARQTATLRKQLGKLALKIPRMGNVYSDPLKSKEHRILVLASKDAANHPDVVDLVEISNGSITRTNHVIDMTYDYLTSEEALKRLLKGKVDEVPSAFEIIGNIAHMNLRDECLPYKHWIGKVVLDKNHGRIRTVVNKLGTIHNVYRTFGMEVMAGYNGEGWSVVSVKEERCTFHLDFREVYWNSRLAGEHKRLVTRIFEYAKINSSKQTVVADLMAGIGPFAVPLTAHGNPHSIKVYANDLNPTSFKYLKINSSKNKCDQLSCYNDDGRAMVRTLQKGGVHVNHFIMNLPASAPEFLDAFRGYAFKSNSEQPWVHVHCFAPKVDENDNFYQSAVDRCAKSLGCSLDREKECVKVHVVRDVSPGKNMLCVSFRLPLEVSRLPSIAHDDSNEGDSDERDAKKLKTN